MIAVIDAVPGWPGFFVFLFAFAIGHVLTDYPLQGSFLAQAKNRHNSTIILAGEAKPPRGLWIHALTAHSLIQGGAVWVISGSVTLAALEVVLHWAIDFFKCEGWFGYTTDQALHITCKAAYALVISTGWWMTAALP